MSAVLHSPQTTTQGQVATLPQEATLLSVIARAAMDPNCDIEKMERLMAMKERIDAQEATTAFNAALSRVQAAMGRVSTDAVNKQTGSMYATYGNLDRALRPIYTAEGFSLSFGTEPAAEGKVGMVCYVSHSGGHTREYRAEVPSDGKGAKGGDVMTKTHAFGSGTSYGMRYMLKMIFNVAIGEDDDDGNGASYGSRQPAARGSTPERDALWKRLFGIASQGTNAYSKAFGELQAEDRKLLGTTAHAALKRRAEEVDAGAAR